MKPLAVWAVVGCISTLAMAGEPLTVPELTADQIAERNVAARGGLEAWRKVQTMVWVGHIDSANAPAPRRPFVLLLKRPNKTRFEIKGQGQAAVRIFDGSQGWKLHASPSGQPEAKPYTPEELRFANDAQGLDGPLMDYQAKGVAVRLDGVDEIEGHKAYRLNVSLPSGASHHVWIDAQSFLEIKDDRESHNAFGQSVMVSVYYRNYQTIEGLQVPLLIESGVGSEKAMDKMVIDRISLNPPLADRMFVKPDLPAHGRQRDSVDTATSPPSVRSMARPVPLALPDTLRPKFQSVPAGAGGGQ